MENNFEERCGFHTQKCGEHLHRAALSRQLALKQVANEQAIRLIPKEELVRAIGPASGSVSSTLEKVLTKSHFVLLKTEFEFFLNRLLNNVWEYHFSHLAMRKQDLLAEKYRLMEFAQSISADNSREFILDKVVPRHGLDNLEKALLSATGISLVGVVSQQDPATWHQVRTAFAIRHLIEHTNGAVDSRFMNDVYGKTAWANSSWRDLEIRQGSRIEIRESDFQTTYEQMVKAVSLIGGAVMKFRPAHGPPAKA